MTGHPDPDVLAEFREGLLGRRRSGRIRAHLAGCARCGALDRELAGVTTLLASTPAPRMPDDLASRLDGVLAAEVAARAAQEDGSRSVNRPRRQWRAPALRIATAAAVLAAVAGGGYGLTRLGGHPSSSGASAAAGRPGLSFGTAGSEKGGNSIAGEPATGSTIVISSGTDYQPGRLAAQAEAVLGRSPEAGPRAALAPNHGSRLQDCVQLVTGGTPPLLVDVARYQGRPATIIVAAAAGGGPAQVWVVGAGCSATSRDVIARTQIAAAG